MELISVMLDPEADISLAEAAIAGRENVTQPTIGALRSWISMFAHRALRENGYGITNLDGVPDEDCQFGPLDRDMTTKAVHAMMSAVNAKKNDLSDRLCEALLSLEGILASAPTRDPEGTAQTREASEIVAAYEALLSNPGKREEHRSRARHTVESEAENVPSPNMMAAEPVSFHARFIMDLRVAAAVSVLGFLEDINAKSADLESQWRDCRTLYFEKYAALQSETIGLNDAMALYIHLATSGNESIEPVLREMVGGKRFSTEEDLKKRFSAKGGKHRDFKQLQKASVFVYLPELEERFRYGMDPFLEYAFRSGENTLSIPESLAPFRAMVSILQDRQENPEQEGGSSE